jgi:two-component system, chemotaxis family, chemotaxis protein CheY
MSKNILAVDDSISIRQMVSFVLKNAGYNVIEAEDGVDALKKIDSAEDHMVITDLNMPNLDGIGLIKQIRMKPAFKFLPVVMLTTESHDSKKLQGREAGATGWNVKPFKPEQLVAVVKKVVGS